MDNGPKIGVARPTGCRVAALQGFLAEAYGVTMTRAEVEQEVERLNREHPEREAYRWMARSSDADEWSIVRVPAKLRARIDPLKATTEAKPQPQQPDDPRTAYDRNVGGPWIG